MNTSILSRFLLFYQSCLNTLHTQYVTAGPIMCTRAYIQIQQRGLYYIFYIHAQKRILNSGAYGESQIRSSVAYM